MRNKILIGIILVCTILLLFDVNSPPYVKDWLCLLILEFCVQIIIKNIPLILPAANVDNDL